MAGSLFIASRERCDKTKAEKKCFPGISFQNPYPLGRYKGLPQRENVWGKHDCEQSFLPDPGHLRFPWA